MYLKWPIFFAFLLSTFCLKAQPPIIYRTDKVFGTLENTVILTGDNFSNNPADLIILFGGNRGSIINSTINSITASVPSNTITGNITVVNKTNGLLGHSGSVFYFSFGGKGFEVSQLATEFQLPETSEMFDLCLCDFNVDGKTDIAATKVSGATDINVYRNNSSPGNLNFTKLNKFTNPELDLLSTTSNITCGDLDGDGLPDLALSKSGNPKNVVFILRNISSGSNIRFSPALSLFLPSENIAKRVIIKDLDKDGKAEVIATNTFNNQVAIFLNKSTVGSLTFEAEPLLLSITGSPSTSGLAVEDLNNDGYPDIVINPDLSSNIYTVINSSTPGDLRFENPEVKTLAGNYNNLSWGDFNDDGKTDIAVTKTSQKQVALLINNTSVGAANISFETVRTISTDGEPWGLFSSDVDGNGKLDLIVGLSDSRALNLLINSDIRGEAEFTKVNVSTEKFTRNISSTDMDGDAKPDFVYTSYDASANKYSVSVIRNNNCFKPEIITANPIVICASDNKLIESTRGINAIYRWKKDNTVVKEGSESFLNISQPGVYTVTAISDGGACEFESAPLTANSGSGMAPEQPVITNSGPFCPGEDIILTTDVVSGATYSWTGPNGFFSSDQNILIPDASDEKSGVYSLQLKIGTCVSNLQSTIVEIAGFPDFIMTTNDVSTFCIGNDVDLTVTSFDGYAYQWLKNGLVIPGANATTYSANEIGTFNVQIVSNNTGCVTSTNSISLNSIEQPNAEFVIAGRPCLGELIEFQNNSTFQSSEEVVFLWDLGDGTPTSSEENISHTYPSIGTYNVSLTVAYVSGACSDINTQPVGIYNLPEFDILSDPENNVCFGDTVILYPSERFEVYLWDNGDTTFSVPVNQPGNYELTVIDQNNCQNTKSINIDMFDLPEVIAFANLYEASPGNQILLEANGALTYLWAPGATLNDSTIANPVATVQESVTYIVAGFDANGCSDTASVFIYVLEGPEINVTPRKVFSPNGDGIDDEWIIENIESYPDNTLTIFNGNGSKVFEASPYLNNWDAVYKGRILAEGAYFYVLHVSGKNPKTGSITVIR